MNWPFFFRRKYNNNIQYPSNLWRVYCMSIYVDMSVTSKNILSSLISDSDIEAGREIVNSGEKVFDKTEIL